MIEICGIPEQRVDVVAVDMADDEDPRIVQVHVESSTARNGTPVQWPLLDSS